MGSPRSWVNAIRNSPRCDDPSWLQGTGMGSPRSWVNTIGDCGVWPSIPFRFGVGIDCDYPSGLKKLPLVGGISCEYPCRLWHPRSRVWVPDDSSIWLDVGRPAGIGPPVLAHGVDCYARGRVGVGVQGEDASGLECIQVDILAGPPVIGVGDENASGSEMLPVVKVAILLNSSQIQEF